MKFQCTTRDFTPFGCPLESSETDIVMLIVLELLAYHLWLHDKRCVFRNTWSSHLKIAQIWNVLYFLRVSYMNNSFLCKSWLLKSQSRFAGHQILFTILPSYVFLAEITIYVFYATAYFCLNLTLKRSQGSKGWRATEISHCIAQKPT